MLQTKDAILETIITDDQNNLIMDYEDFEHKKTKLIKTINIDDKKLSQFSSNYLIYLMSIIDAKENFDSVSAKLTVTQIGCDFCDKRTQIMLHSDPYASQIIKKQL